MRPIHPLSMVSFRERRLLFMSEAVPNQEQIQQVVKRAQEELNARSLNSDPRYNLDAHVQALAQNRIDAAVKGGAERSQHIQESLQKMASALTVGATLDTTTLRRIFSGVANLTFTGFGGSRQVTVELLTEQERKETNEVEALLERVSDGQRSDVEVAVRNFMTWLPPGRRGAVLSIMRGAVDDSAKMDAIINLRARLDLEPALRTALFGLSQEQIRNPDLITEAQRKANPALQSAFEFLNAGTTTPAMRETLAQLVTTVSVQNTVEQVRQGMQIPEKQQKEMVARAESALRTALGGNNGADLSTDQKNKIKGTVMMSHGVDVREVQEGGRPVFKVTAPSDQLAKIMNHIGGFLMILESFKKTLNEVRRKVNGQNSQTQERIPGDATAIQRAQIEGRNTIMNYTGGPTPERQNDQNDTFTIVGNVGESRRSPSTNGQVTLTIRWNNNQWEWKDTGSDSTAFVPAGQSPYRETQRSNAPEDAISPQQLAIRRSLNQLGRELANINAPVAKEIAEKTTKETTAKAEKEQKEKEAKEKEQKEKEAKEKEARDKRVTEARESGVKYITDQDGSRYGGGYIIDMPNTVWDLELRWASGPQKWQWAVEDSGNWHNTFASSTNANANMNGSDGSWNNEANATASNIIHELDRINKTIDR